MDKYERLQALLRKIVDEKCDGTASELARRIERNPTYVHRLFYPPGKNGAKGIGPSITDACNAAFDLPRGFWDLNPEEAFSSEPAPAYAPAPAPVNKELLRGVLEIDEAIKQLSDVKRESLELLFGIWAKRKLHVGTIAHEIFEFLSQGQQTVRLSHNSPTAPTETGKQKVTRPQWGHEIGQDSEIEERDATSGSGGAAK